MGYGKNLKTAADAYGISLRKLGLMTGISPQTLYGAVKRDNGLRYDHALRIAEILDITPDFICKHAPVEADKKAEGHIKRAMEQLADAEKKEWLAKNTDVSLGSDAFFPFGDNIERAHKSGVTAIAQPGGSIRDDNVIATCDTYNIAMCFTGIRLFHH